MVGEITDAAHQIFGRFVVEPKPTNLNILCELIISDLQATIAGNHHLLLIGDESLSHAMVDERLVNRILINLLSNAVKYSPQDTRINLLLRQEENEVVIEVADQGIGISPDDQKHLFEPFFRASNAGVVRGTGLGLNIVGDCVRLHHGTISLKSELGRGSTFTVRLPLNLESTHEDTEKSA
jgi:signal transduction histidine kinase